DPAGTPLAAELQPDDDDEEQREDEDEEDVRPVAREPPQLGAGDRQRRPHAATPRSGTSRETTARTTAKPSIVRSGPVTSPSPPPPALTPSARVNAATGLRSRIPAAAPEAATGKKAPPAMPSTTAMIDWATPACSDVRATRTTTNVRDVAAATTLRTRTRTTSGEPKSTSKRSVPAASRTSVATTPRT